VTASDESLVLELPDASRFELYPETDTRFFHVGFRGPDPATLFEAEFTLDEAGRVVAMVMPLGSDDVVFPRIASGEATEDSVPLPPPPLPRSHPPPRSQPRPLSRGRPRLRPRLHWPPRAKGDRGRYGHIWAPRRRWPPSVLGGSFAAGTVPAPEAPRSGPPTRGRPPCTSVSPSGVCGAKVLHRRTRSLHGWAARPPASHPVHSLRSPSDRNAELRASSPKRSQPG